MSPPDAAAAKRAEREHSREAARRRDLVYEAVRRPPTDLAFLTAELATGIDPGASEGDSTPLILAALWQKNYPVVALFLPHLRPAALTTVYNGRPLGLTLVHGLLVARRPDLARRLLDRGWRPVPDRSDVSSNLGRLALRTGDLALIAPLHEAGFSLEGDLTPPLLEAVAQQNLPLLNFLLETPRPDGRPRHPDDLTGNGLTPLFAAADLGWTEGVRALLAAGARDFHGDHATGRTLRDAAAPWPEITRLLQTAPARAVQ